MSNTDIKWFTSDNLNAPQLSNNWGVLIDVLDACLVTGLGNLVAASVTAAGKTVTVNFNSAHGYKQYQVVQIAGANESEFNTQHRILSVSNTSLTFELSSATAHTTASGTITCKLAPLGFDKVFSGTQKAAYRSKNILKNPYFLRVDNSLDPVYTTTFAKFGKVGICENMSDMDTMTGHQAPFDTANPTKNWVGTGSGNTAVNGWAKWYYTKYNPITSGSPENLPQTSNDRKWLIVGNESGFLFFPSMTTVSDTIALCYGFFATPHVLNTGETECFLSSTVNNNSVSSQQTYGVITPLCNSYNFLFCLRKYDRTAANELARCLGSLGTFSGGTSGQANTFASEVNANMLYFVDTTIIDTQNFVRGKVPFLHWLYQTTTLVSGTIVRKGNDIFIIQDVASNANGKIAIKIGEV